MEIFEAISASEVLQLPPEGAGVVLSVHDNYINILLSGGVVALSRNDSATVPFGAAVAAGESWHCLGLRKNHPVQVHDDELILAGVASIRRINTCPRFSCRPRREVGWGPDILAARLTLLADLCLHSAREGGIFTYLGPQDTDAARGLFERRMRQRFQALITGIRTNDDFLIIEGAHGLMGVGPGLTPSGDDFLLGFLAGLVNWPSDDCRTAAAKLANCLAKDAPTQTTRIAAEYLRYAARGCYHSYLNRLINAFTAGADSELAAAAAEIITLGHYSGTDLLFGFVCGGQTAHQAGERGESS